jgi:hypothetical protein
VFLKALVDQDKDGLSKAIAAKATGDLAKIRKGEADSRAVTRFTETYGRLFVNKVAPVTRGDERIVVMSPNQNADSKTKKGLKQIVLRKEDGAWKVFDLK